MAMVRPPPEEVPPPEVIPPPEVELPPEVVVHPIMEEPPTIVPMAPPVAKKKIPWPIVIGVPLAAIAGMTMLTRAAKEA